MNVMQLIRAGYASGGAAPAFDPSALIGAGQGEYFEAAQLSTLFQDAAGTTPVAANNDPVRRWVGLANSSAVTASSDAARPLYKTAGGLHWVENDGTDDLLLGSLGFNLAPGAYVCLAVARGTNTGPHVFFRLSAASGGNDYLAFNAQTSQRVNAVANAFSEGTVGITTALSANDSFAVETAYVLEAMIPASGSNFTHWINGGSPGTIASNWPSSIVLGDVQMRFPFTVNTAAATKLYAAFVRTSMPNESERTALLDYMAGLSGVTL